MHVILRQHIFRAWLGKEYLQYIEQFMQFLEDRYYLFWQRCFSGVSLYQPINALRTATELMEQNSSQWWQMMQQQPMNKSLNEHYEIILHQEHWKKLPVEVDFLYLMEFKT